MSGAIPGTVPISVSSDYTNLIPTYYDKLLLETLTPELRFYNFGEKKPLPKDSGKTIVWNRYNIPEVSGFLTEGTVPSAVKMTTMKVSAVVRQLGGYTEITDVTDLTTIDNSVESAVKMLALAAAKSIDSAIRTEIYNGLENVSTWSHCIIKNSAGQFDVWGQASCMASAGDHGTRTILGTGSANLMAASDLRAAAMSLRKLNAPTVDGNYKAIIHPAVLEDLMADTVFTQYAQANAVGQKVLETGRIGTIFGIDLYESTNAPYTSGYQIATSNSSSLAYGTLVIGRGMYGVTELDGGVKTETIKGASKYDPLNQWTTVSWKISMAAKLLNPSCGITVWTGSGDASTAGDSQL